MHRSINRTSRNWRITWCMKIETDYLIHEISPNTIWFSCFFFWDSEWLHNKFQFTYLFEIAKFQKHSYFYMDLLEFLWERALLCSCILSISLLFLLVCITVVHLFSRKSEQLCDVHWFLCSKPHFVRLTCLMWPPTSSQDGMTRRLADLYEFELP